MSRLELLAAKGWVVDEWEIWQQGRCGTYAVALMMVRPSLRLGTLGEVDEDDGFHLMHFFAHDDEFAYDSAGRHPLPYLGVWGDEEEGDDEEEGLRMDLDQGPPVFWGIPDEEAGPEGTEFWLTQALGHIARHDILRQGPDV